MSKEIIKIDEQEKLENLAERVKAIIAETRFAAQMTLVEGKHLVGQEIVEDTLYKKGKWGAGELIKKIARAIGKSEQDLYLCVQFYLKYPKLSTAIETLKPEKKSLTWNNIRGLLPEPKGKKEERHFMTCEINHENRTITINKKYED